MCSISYLFCCVMGTLGIVDDVVVYYVYRADIYVVFT